MRSLKRVFEKIKKKNPFWSDYICFSLAITGRGFSKKTIYRYFNKLVDKEDYPIRDKKAILEYLISFSQGTKTSLKKAGLKDKLAI